MEWGSALGWRRGRRSDTPPWVGDIVLSHIEAAAEVRTAVVSAKGQRVERGRSLIEAGHRHSVLSRVSVARQPDPRSCPACLIKQWLHTKAGPYGLRREQLWALQRHHAGLFIWDHFWSADNEFKVLLHFIISSAVYGPSNSWFVSEVHGDVNFTQN